MSKLLDSQWGWGRATRASLLDWLVHAHVEASGVALPMEEVAAVPLFQDVAGSNNKHILTQLLQGARGLTVVNDDGGSVAPEARAERRDEGEAEREGRALRAVRWRLHSMMGNFEDCKRMLDEIRAEHSKEVDKVAKWEASVALSTAYYMVAQMYGPKLQSRVYAFDRALSIRSDTLGEVRV